MALTRSEWSDRLRAHTRLPAWLTDWPPACLSLTFIKHALFIAIAIRVLCILDSCSSPSSSSTQSPSSLVVRNTNTTLGMHLNRSVVNCRNVYHSLTLLWILIHIFVNWKPLLASVYVLHTAAYTEPVYIKKNTLKWFSFLSVARINSVHWETKKENTKNCPLNLFIKNNWQNQKKNKSTEYKLQTNISLELQVDGESAFCISTRARSLTRLLIHSIYNAHSYIFVSFFFTMQTLKSIDFIWIHSFNP